jgi:hypothetical protein
MIAQMLGCKVVSCSHDSGYENILLSPERTPTPILNFLVGMLRGYYGYYTPPFYRLEVFGGGVKRLGEMVVVTLVRASYRGCLVRSFTPK